MRPLNDSREAADGRVLIKRENVDRFTRLRLLIAIPLCECHPRMRSRNVCADIDVLQGNLCLASAETDVGV